MLLRPTDERPELFSDTLFTMTKKWFISTSNLSDERFENWGWGEVTPLGIGVAYIIRKGSLTYNVTSCNEGWAEAVTTNIEAALRDMVAFCTAAKEKGSALRSKL